MLNGRSDHRLGAYYSDARYLRERQGGADRGSVGAQFADWVLDLVEPKRFTSVLDAGAGVGRFTSRIAERVQPGATITAVDRFPSMVEALRALPVPPDVEVRVVEADISRLPFAPASFDLVMANHVLYHVTDLPSTLSGLARLLTLGGLLVATTNADHAVVPVLNLHRAVCDQLGVLEIPDASPFSSETAGPILGSAFSTVIEYKFTRQATATTPRDLVLSYRSTGRYQLLCQDHSAGRVNQIADDVVAEWTSHPDKLVGEVRMSAFLCSDPSAELIGGQRHADQ